MTQEETRVIETCRLNYDDSYSRPAVAAAVLDLDDAERGSWKLVATLVVAGDLKTAEKAHNQREKGLKISQRTPFVPTLPRPPHAGYIAFRDKKVVLFYTNDLAATPIANVVDGSTREAQKCCNGLGFVQRWTETEVFRKSNVSAPAIACV
ncbi:unnamed protein product [Phytophthora fragariaefolia]|uniref:Unnamed protein product n=1 Tax=Phytophthora fragariaefolia TaxID=1490495 RepID=A0A9W6XA51_9STRA|nr:unnamed protein product [Phytophthora fragariaefolia]